MATDTYTLVFFAFAVRSHPAAATATSFDAIPPAVTPLTAPAIQPATNIPFFFSRPANLNLSSMTAVVSVIIFPAAFVTTATQAAAAAVYIVSLTADTSAVMLAAVAVSAIVLSAAGLIPAPDTTQHSTFVFKTASFEFTIVSMTSTLVFSAIAHVILLYTVVSAANAATVRSPPIEI